MKIFKRIMAFIMFSTIVITSSISSSFASWNTGESGNDIAKSVTETISGIPQAPVCYIAETNVEYPSVKRALEIASSSATSSNVRNVVVYPFINSNDITKPGLLIEEDLNIADYVYLTICIEKTKYAIPTIASNANSITNSSTSYGNITANKRPEFADQSTKISTYLKSNIGFGSDEKSITVNISSKGRLQVAGECGTGTSNQYPNGHTNGNYAQITMFGETTINCNGTIDCYGYIKKATISTNASVILNNGGDIRVPFIIYDYRGGSFSSAANTNNVMPFSVFDFLNCQANLTINYGAALNGRVVAYANDNIYITEATAIGSSGIFKLSSGCHIVIKVTPKDFPYTSNDLKAGTTKVFTYGSFTFSSMSLSLAGTSISTSSFHLPICYKYDIQAVTGTITVANKIKFLKGSKLTINSGVIANINNEMAVYYSYTDQATTGVKGTNVYPASSFENAKFTVNGTANLNSKFGGLILTSSSSGKIITGSNFTNSIKLVEMLTGESLGTSYTSNYVEGYAHVYVDSNNSMKKINKSSEYLSSGTYWLVSSGDAINTSNETVTTGPSNSCLVEGTLITMADGSQKPVENVHVGDLVMSFNYLTGAYEPTPIIFNNHLNAETQQYSVLTLRFSDGKSIDFVGNHGIFDSTLKKYVFIDEFNYEDYIGHEFIIVNNGTNETATLISGSVEIKETRIFAPVSYFYMNVVANDILTVAPPVTEDNRTIDAIVNYFEFNADASWDIDAMNRDIALYGLYSYEDFAEYITEEAYMSSPSVYLKAAVEKGLMTYQDIIDVIMYLLNRGLIDGD